MNLTIPTREVLWNISHIWLMYLLFVIALAIAGYGLWRRIAAWRRGLPAERFDRPKERLQRLLKHALGQRRTIRERYAAVFHTFIYTGFIVLTIATSVVAVHHDFGLPLMQGAFYLYFQSFTVDVFGALVLIGVGIAFWRRVSLKPKKLVYTDEAELILGTIFLIALTGFLLEGWRIAAIYRGAELVIPTGDTVIAADDRVLVIGNPEILPGVAEQLRMGVPQFPLRNGNRVVVYLPSGRNKALEQESEQLTLKTRAAALLRLYPRAEERKEIIEHALQSHSSRSPRHQRKTFEDMPLDGDTLVSHVAQLRTLRPGLLVAASPTRTMLEHMSGRNGAAGTICNALRCPVLFSNGAKEYGRIIYVLLAGLTEPTLTDTAIDLVRMLGLPLSLLRVSLPEYMEAKDEATEQTAAEITRRARLYGIGIETLRLEGNPVREIIKAVRSTDLLLIGRHPSSRDSFTSPDVALRVARAARCSTLVQTSVRS